MFSRSRSSDASESPPSAASAAFAAAAAAATLSADTNAPKVTSFAAVPIKSATRCPTSASSTRL